MGKLAVVKLRGDINARSDVKDTLKLIGLTRVNHCIIMDDGPPYLGMIQKVKDYVTWGEVNAETLLRLLNKRGMLTGDRRLSDEFVKSNTKFQTIAELASAIIDGQVGQDEVSFVKKVFRLHPPSGGYKSTKRPVKDLGDLGYRGARINELIVRMT